MRRQHRDDPSDDTYICDTDRYRLQQGCYYHIRLPSDGRTLSMLPPTDWKYNYYGLMGFGPSNPALFALDEDFDEFWKNGEEMFLTVQSGRDTQKSWVQRHPFGFNWHIKIQRLSLNASRTSSGENLLWADDMGGSLRLADMPYVESGDSYYPPVYTPCFEQDKKNETGNFTVEFVYQGDI